MEMDLFLALIKLLMFQLLVEIRPSSITSIMAHIPQKLKKEKSRFVLLAALIVTVLLVMKAIFLIL